MQAKVPPHKVLVAVDGSEQSLRAIRYAAGVFPPHRTRLVLFHVQAQLFDLFSDLSDYPHYTSRVTGLKRWATEQKMDISNVMDSAVVYFKQKGFPESAISIKTPAQNLGVTQDIIRESYAGYDAVVLGRTGWSRFKDWLVKSTAMQLVSKIKHIPVVVVGGRPEAKNLLVAFDGTHGAMRGVVCVGALVGTSNHRILLYSMIDHREKFWAGEEPFFAPTYDAIPLDTCGHKIGADLMEARNRLLDEGIAADRIAIKVHAIDRDRPSNIVHEAMQCGYGGVVVGRRGLISFIDAFFIGRVSDKVLKLADEMAVWVI